MDRALYTLTSQIENDGIIVGTSINFVMMTNMEKN